METFYVTTPIYYVNDAPHIGHAYTTLLADVLARYHRLLQRPTFFLTGTDEHGQKVYEAAREAGISAQEQCDRTVVRFQNLWKKLEVTHDDFIRTTEERHTRVVQRILTELWERGEIYRGEYEGWYCVSDERFYAESELVDGLSPEGRPVEKVTESNYFFRMSHYQQWLIDYIHEHPDFIQPDFRRNETLGFLKQPLGDLCISRPKARLPWGIELPFDTDYVCYVWFDALVNYISAIGYTSDPERFQRWWPATYHLIGKDILTTHTVYWPTMLKAMGIEMPKTIFAHGWWLTGTTKMSKSLGNVTNPMEIADKYGVDPLRYFLMAEMTLGQDASFTEEAFVLRYNADLANDLGNLASRTLKMVAKNLDGKVPDRVTDRVGDEELQLERTCLEAIEAMERHLASMSLDRGVADVMGAVRAANRYFDAKAPWRLLKEGDAAGFSTVLYTAMESLRVVSGLLYPVIPEKMSELRRSLGVPEEELVPRLETLRSWGRLTPGASIGTPPTLFPRAEKPKAAEAGQQRQARGGGGEGGKPPAKQKKEKAVSDKISIEDFSKVELRLARVESAELVEGADKLLKLQVDLGGEEKRQLIAGMASHYTPDEITGKTIVVVANLEPAEIRGEQSEGMLLAAQKGKQVRLLTVDGDLPPGSKIR
jgi:methionyl-tRNA synthetase